MTNFVLPVASLFVAATAALTGLDALFVLSRGPLIQGEGVASQPAAAGETITVHWSIDKRTECEGYSSRVWTGGLGFHLSEPVQANSLPMGLGEYTIPTTIPEQAPVGPLLLTIRGHFDCPRTEPEYFALGPVAIEVIE